MAKFKEKLQLRKHVKNWWHNRQPKKNKKTLYTTKGVPYKFEVTPPFYDVFKEIFIEDFYKIDELISQIPSNAIIVDVGANAGYFSFLALSKLKDAKVYAFEPMAVNVELFTKNISLNKNLEQRLTFFPKAMTGDRTGPIEIFYDTQTNNPIIASVFEDFSSLNNQTKQVDAISLQDFIVGNNIRQIDLLKLDCEGSEFPILYNSPVSVWEVIKGMTVEVHNLDGEKRNADSLIEFLETKGYVIDKHIAENGCFSLNAFRKD
jgi:FkbM family methyltransferase